MVVVNLRDGSTLSFDPTDTRQREALAASLATRDISGVALLHAGRQYVLPRPRQFRGLVTYGCEVLRNGRPEPIGERIWVQVEDVRASVSLTYAGSVVRTDLARCGRMQYNSTRRPHSG